jgi:Zn finger protein HypA/HybF involved in hydrogenase expression
MIPYHNRAGERLFKPEFGVDVDEFDIEDNVGWCLTCGETVDNVEPDARGYTCEVCSKPRIYGLTELILMNLVA